MDDTPVQTALARPSGAVSMRQLWEQEGVTVGTGVYLNPDLLRRALLRRGVDVTGFAEDADVCAATIYKVLAGEAVRMSTVLKIGRSLSRLPLVPCVEELLGEAPAGPFLVRASDRKTLA